jgi:hypothetical protein
LRSWHFDFFVIDNGLLLSIWYDVPVVTTGGLMAATMERPAKTFTPLESENWFLSLRPDSRVITTERFESAPRNIPGIARTNTVRTPNCRVCGDPVEDLIHNALLKVHQGHITIQKVSERYDYRADHLERHMRDCMDLGSRDGMHAPSAVEQCLLPCGNVRVLRIIDVIKSFDRSQWAETEIENKNGYTITIRKRKDGPREWLEEIWFKGTRRSTLLDGEYLRDQISRDIAVTLEAFAQRLALSATLGYDSVKLARYYSSDNI